MTKLFDKGFTIYFILTLIFTSLLNFVGSRPIKVFSIFAIASVQSSYTLYTFLKKEKKALFSKILGVIVSILLFISAFIYTASSMGEMVVAIYTSLLTLLSIFIMGTIAWATGLWRSKSYGWAFLSYILLVFMTIMTFALIMGSFTIFGIVNTECHTCKPNLFDYLYFSGTIFYSNTFGEFIPANLTKVLVILESLFSVIIHVFIISRVLNRLNNGENNNG